MLKDIKMLLFLSMLLFVSCGSEDDGGAEQGAGITLTCSPDMIDAPVVGGTYTLDVSSSRGEWTAYADDDSKSWLKVSVAGSMNTQGTVTVTVAENKETSSRNGSVVVKSGAKSITVPVTQGVPMQVEKNTVYSISTGETIVVGVTASGDWTVTSNDTWIKATRTVDGASAIQITTAPNTAMTMRTGTVDVQSGAEKITVTVTQNSAEDTDISAPEGYQLVWHDEFNQSVTLGRDWTHEVKPAGWVNNELQTYVNGQVNGQRVTELIDGRLRINCFKGNDGKIYSARVYAKVNEGWKYGYFEARIKLPEGKGTWPAFWMMPVNFRNWPEDGEIDIMEEVGVDAGWVSSTIHCNKYNNTNTSIEHGSKFVPTAESDYHVYACEWTSANLKFYVDGEEILNYRNDGSGYDAWPFDQPYYVILNLAWGGAWGGYNGVDNSALPVTMEVDYVRVFQKLE